MKEINILKIEKDLTLVLMLYRHKDLYKFTFCKIFQFLKHFTILYTCQLLLLWKIQRK